MYPSPHMARLTLISEHLIIINDVPPQHLCEYSCLIDGSFYRWGTEAQRDSGTGPRSLSKASILQRLNAGA